MIRHGMFRAAVAAGGAALVTLAALLVGGATAVARTADVCVLGAAVSVLCAAVFFYVHWHIGSDPSVAWLVTAAAAYSLQGLNWFTLSTSGSEDAGVSDGTPAWVYLFQIVLMAGLGTLLVRGDRLPVRWDPLALGLVLGLAAIVCRTGVLAIPAPVLAPAGQVAVLTCLGVVGLMNAARLLLSTVLDAGLRSGIALASVFLTVGQVSATAAASDSVLVVSALANVSGSALLVTMAVSRARTAVADEASALVVLRSRLELADHDLHDGEARRHEVRATVAGIATATELMQRAEISPARREQLHQMTVAELGRLERLVSTRPAVPPEPTELDATLRPVVVRHEASGLMVSWRPSGHVAIARPDDVAEIVNVLLSNAHRHAGGRRVRIEIRTVGTTVELAVSDDGPGIDPAVRQQLFSWGVRGPRSPGQGVGLAAARMLAEDLDGRLDVSPDAERGARFVLSLPAPVVAAPQGLRR